MRRGAPHAMKWDVGSTKGDVEARKGRTSHLRGPLKVSMQNIKV
jgi:hypothetical protein